MFTDLVDDFKTGDATGPEVTRSLANLADMLLQMKVSESVVVEKRSAYLRPKNVQYLKAPRITKPIWETLNAFSRIRDSGLQSVQTDLLKSGVPVIKVMEKLYNAKDDLGSLDATDLCATLKDSLLFLGSAHVEMNKLRRDNVKSALL